MKKTQAILAFTLTITALFLFTTSAHAAKKVIGILVYDGVLTSDVTAPAEVFGIATKQAGFTDYTVKMISVNAQPYITTEEGLKISVNSNIDEAQALSVLIVPSAYDMQPLLDNEQLIRFIQHQSRNADWIASNCSGSLLLAEAELLNGKKATTWFGGEDELRKSYPLVIVQDNQNVVIDGNIITSNGSIVSYTAAIKLLSLMSNEKLARDVFDTLQMGRLL